MSIPKTNEGLRIFAANLISLCNTNKTAWNIPADAVTELQTLNTAYDTALAAAEAPSGTPADTVAKNEASAALRHALRAFIGGHLDYNPVITDPIRENLGLPLKDTVRSPVQRPKDAPVLTLQIRAPRTIDVHLKPLGAAGTARPHGCNGAVIRSGILDAPPPNPEALPKSLLATKPVHTYEFDETERGLTVYFAAAWQNEKGELGPFTEIFSEKIP